MEFLKKGDSFIRFSKYGNTKGVVKNIFEETVLCSDFNYIKHVVESTNGVFYEANECFKITKFLNDEAVRNRKDLISTIAEKSKVKVPKS